MLKKLLTLVVLCLCSLAVFASSSVPSTLEKTDAAGASASPQKAFGTSENKPNPIVIAENLVVGEIRELSGKAILNKQGEARGASASVGDALKAQDVLRTKRNSNAVIQLIDGSTVLLQEKSSIHLKGLQSLSLEEGTVLFDIRKRGNSKGLRVSTKTAVIGVKGTQFLVKDENDQVDVYLNKGRVEVNPVEGSFKHYKAVTSDSFDEYSKQMMSQFEEEKQKMRQGIADMKREFVEYLKSFDMEAGTAVSISGDELTSYPMPDDYNALFEALDKQAELTRKRLNLSD
ncbi:FecR family protein [Litoribacillus peritrichatus]|uniref:FecR protein domain-containing protein n=1 Tax=Litoribacillus peritrichatus TaxID=718191 RepID=A0ABP7M1J5_9GAMM